MKLVIHVGPPKTGTTALQRALFKSRDKLLNHQILYPDPRYRKGYNHGHLCYLFRPFSEAPRGMKKGGQRKYIKQGEALKDEIERQVRQSDPNLLVLSSEWFARLYQAQDTSAFFAFLESLSPESVEFILYARRPSDFFLSASQQRLRAASLFEPIYPWNLDQLIDGFKRISSEHAVTVRAFDRQSMNGGSIIHDFASLYFPQASDALQVAQTKRQSNESFSAETMVLLQRFRRDFFSEQEDVFNERTRKLMRRLQKIDLSDGNPRPKLRPEWRDYLDYGRLGALGLRDRHGVSFSGFDYERLEQKQLAPRPSKGADVADFVSVDKIRLKRQLDELSNSLWSLRPSNAAWLRRLRDEKDVGLMGQS